MICANLGERNDYIVSSVRVLDGRNGAELWTFDSAYGAMSSALTIAAAGTGLDAMLFIGIGNLDSNSDQSHSHSERYPRHGFGTESKSGDDPLHPLGGNAVIGGYIVTL